MAGSGGPAAYADTASGISVAVTKNLVSGGALTTFDLLAGLVMDLGGHRWDTAGTPPVPPGVSRSPPPGGAPIARR